MRKKKLQPLIFKIVIRLDILSERSIHKGCNACSFKKKYVILLVYLDKEVVI